MKNNKKKTNTLIKRNNLMSLMRERGINRISPSATDKIESLIKEFIEDNIEKIKQRAFSNGRKTITEEDIELKINTKSNKNLEI